jgi:adenylate kinase family enzyme
MRIAVVGSSGSGKTTLARGLGQALDLPFIELDAINWQAGWTDLNTSDPAEFVRRVETAVASDAWISDGNYSRVRPMLWKRATHLVWLDYDRSVIMRRVIRRSFHRSLTGRELWPGTGNRETWTRWLDKEHPIRWAWDTYHRRRAAYETMLAEPGYGHLEIHRLRHPREADGVIERLMVSAKKNAGGVPRSLR